MGVKYNLKDLTTLSENFIEENLSLQNVFRVLILADRLSASKTRENAIIYLFQHWKRASQ